MTEISNEYKIIDVYDKTSNHIRYNVRKMLLGDTNVPGGIEAERVADDTFTEVTPVRNAVMYLIREAVNTRNKHAKTTTS